MEGNTKYLMAVFSLMLGLSWGIPYVVSDTDERNTSWIMLAFFFFVVALLFWLWIMREQRSASEIAEDTLDTAEEKLRKLEEQAKAQIHPTEDEADSEPEPVVEPKSEPVAEAIAEPEAIVDEDTTEPLTDEEQSAGTIAVEVEEDDDDEATAPLEDATSDGEPDDLSRIEGIGPKYSEILIGAGVTTFAQIAEMNEEQIVALVKENGGRKSASMATWAEQAKLASAGDWEALARLQEELSGGRRD